MLASRSSVKVHPATVQKTRRIAERGGQQDCIHEEPPPASSPNQEHRGLPLSTTAASIWSAVESKLKGLDGSHCRRKAKTTNWDTLYVYIASVYEDFTEVNGERPLLTAAVVTAAVSH